MRILKIPLMFEYPPKNSISHLEGKETSSTQECLGRDVGYVGSQDGTVFFKLFILNFSDFSA